MQLFEGDSRDVLSSLADSSIDACVTDPPYALNFMGKAWDDSSVVHDSKFWFKVLRALKPGAHLLAFGGTRTNHRMVCAIEDAGFEIRDQLQWIFGSGFPKSHNLGDGWGTALKPAFEPICLARRPLSEDTVAANVLRWGTGAINVDGCRVPGAFESGWSRSGSNASENISMSGPNYFRDPKPDNASGRWPANVIHDGSDEVVGLFPETVSGNLQTHHRIAESANGSMSGKNYARSPRQDMGGDSGSAARFFYSAKADGDDRLGSKHPMVKPVDLMQYLVRLITPPKGTVLDPFAGTGTTGEACHREGFSSILIERDPQYILDIKRRFSLLAFRPRRAQARVNQGQAPRHAT